MSLIFNRNNITAINYNGNKVTKVIYNRNIVWTSETKKSTSQTVSTGTIDHYDNDEYQYSDGSTSFTVPSSVPLNKDVTISVTFSTTSAAGDFYTGRSSITVGKVYVSVSGFSAAGQSKSSTTTGKLANRDGSIYAYGYHGSVNISATITYSWME